MFRMDLLTSQISLFPRARVQQSAQILPALCVTGEACRLGTRLDFIIRLGAGEQTRLENYKM